MSLSTRRIRAIVWKEFREFRRNRSLIVAMAIFPLIFLIQPLFAVFRVAESSSTSLGQVHLLLYMLAIPVLVPATVAATAVVGERQQGTLEPVLTTPIRRAEFLLGKALAVLLPSVVIAYFVYAVFLASVVLFAHPAVASAILRTPDILAQVLFTPLLALWSIWVGIAVSVRSSDVRVAQQLSLLGNLPVVALTSLIAFDVIHATLGLAVGAGAVLVLADAFGWRIVSPMFDRERLITGTRCFGRGGPPAGAGRAPAAERLRCRSNPGAGRSLPGRMRPRGQAAG
jgi:ABC-type transport system involved in multi-copper enzyme maturation permease subunit